MTNALLPIRLFSSIAAGGGIYEYRDVFIKSKPEYIDRVEGKGTKWEWTRREKFSWYTFDVIVHSQTEIEFIVFDMEDFVYGGKGREFHRFSVTVDKKVTRKSIENKLLERAAIKRELELALKEGIIIQGYANQEAADLGIKF